MELAIIAWLYVWGAVSTWALCAFSNHVHDGELRGWGAAGVAVVWFVIIPIFFGRRVVMRLLLSKQ